MPDIDVSDILLDTDVAAETFSVIRRQQTLVKGRSQGGETTISPNPIGSVIPQQDSPMIRGPEQQNLPRLISVHTPFRLRGVSKDSSGNAFLPDIVVWKGARYVVNKVHDFSSYGGGFIQADCSSQDSVEPAPT